MKGESPRISPAAERKLGEVKRPTIKKKADEEAKRDRAVQVSLQIPELMRASLQKKIDARIARNIAQSKKLRTEARQLLEKFVAESPENSAELPEALVRLGELEWEESRG